MSSPSVPQQDLRNRKNKQLIVPPINTQQLSSSSSSSNTSPSEADSAKQQQSECRTPKDEFIDALNKPHTITILVASFAVLFYYSFIRHDAVTTEQNVKRGIMAMIGLFLVYCVVQLRDGILMRPHPGIWRFITGIGLVYLLFLVFLMFQTKEDARQFMKYLDPSLGVPLPERDYANNCDVYTPNNPVSYFKNVYDTIYDEFILAHVLGYIAKALLFRDMKLCWCLSLFFEIMEITFQHWLPNFKECWWDHIIIDVLICNNIGIIIGLWICDYLKMRKYPLWIGVTKMDTTPKKIKRIFQQFTPFNWTSYDWHIFDDAKHFLYFCAIVLAMNIVDLNAFFLKYVLWVPPPNKLNIYRLLIWFCLGMPAIREYYQYISDPNTKRIGANTWIAIGIIFTEILVYFKFSEGYYLIPFPHHIWVNWVLFFMIIIPWFIVFFFVTNREMRKRNPLLKFALNATLTLSMVPLIFMFLSGCPDLQYGRDWFDNTVEGLLQKYAYSN
ncbi:hypothetical protein C9374_013458 [Naegleria lovaniensis]|uniref:Phosphatidylserine synthase n=1 Tax=Naegleria lovaniensis TaxID=51637 RepID=A0AA88KND4_NAELO|nr:uncharacterized protein C9374_013458 [Naegleria lovaniensis]KAG2391973.1 hypothetical protein C9374_013458 [Naegleria lovaniensis]